MLDDGGKFLIANCMLADDEDAIAQVKRIDGMTLYTDEELERRLKDAGFKRVRVYHKKRTDFTAIVASK